MLCARCFRSCNIGEGKKGYCGVVGVKKGCVQTVAYQARLPYRLSDGYDPLAKISSIVVGPIEEKRIFHYQPGMKILSIGCYGCNLHCNYCQNREISQGSVPRFTKEISAASAVEAALREKVGGVAFSHSEPLVMFDFVQDTFRFARKEGLKTVLKTNGLYNPALFRMLLPSVDAVNIDVKGTEEAYEKHCNAKNVLTVLAENLKSAKEQSHLEVSLPMPPGEAVMMHRVIEWVALTVGPQIPIHILPVISSDAATLSGEVDRAVAYAKLVFEYAYNASPGRESAIECKKCKTKLICWRGTEISYNYLKDGRCHICLASIIKA